MKNRLKLFTSGKNKTNYSLLAVIMGIVLGFLVYYVSRQILLSIMLPFISFGAVSLVSPIIFQDEKRKKYARQAKDYLKFYNDFEMFSFLESDYQLGFEKAIENLPSSTLKESLQEYLDENKVLDDALALTGDKEETNLIDEIKRCLKDGHDYYSPNPRLNEFIVKYEKGLKIRNSNFDFSLISCISLISLVLVIILLVYASRK